MTSVAVADLDRRSLIRQSARTSHRRRQVLGIVAACLCGLALCIALVPLVSIVIFTISKGIGAWSVNFFTHIPTPAGIPGAASSTPSSGP